MAGNRYRSQIVIGSMARDGGAQTAQVFAGRPHGFADAGADFDLALEKFGADLTLQVVLAGLEQAIGGSGQIKTVAVHQQIFFFDTYGEVRLHE